LQSSSRGGGGGGGGTRSTAVTGSTGKAQAESSYLLPEDSADGNNFVSEFEKAHPLVVPKALSQVNVP